jgi:hypothetical protein
MAETVRKYTNRVVLITAVRGLLLWVPFALSVGALAWMLYTGIIAPESAGR